MRNEWSRRPRPDDVLELSLTDLDEAGAGLGRATLRPDAKTQIGWSVHVRHALPGERVRARVRRASRKRAELELLEVLEPSPDRVTPPCAHAGPYDGAGRGCGGCALQAMAPAALAAHKDATVRRLLAAVGVDDGCFEPFVHLREPYRHRNKMEFSFGDDHDRAPALGLHPSGLRYELLDVGDCLVFPQWAMAAVGWTRAWRVARMLPHHEESRDRGWLRTLTVRVGHHTGDWSLDLCTADADAPVRADGSPIDAAAEVDRWAAEMQAAAIAAGLAAPALWWTRHRARRGERTRRTTVALLGATPIQELVPLAGRAPQRFEIPPQSFFQPSSAGAELIYGAVRELLAPHAGGRLLDLYCGTGSVGLALADRCSELVGVELDPAAVAAADRNAALNGVGHARFIAGDAARTMVEHGLDAPGRFDVVVVDPPRAGLAQAAVEAVAAVAAPVLAYVSCRPSSLARDVAALAEHGYRVARVRVVDQFPHTPHVETVALLLREGDGAAR